MKQAKWFLVLLVCAFSLGCGVIPQEHPPQPYPTSKPPVDAGSNEKEENHTDTAKPETDNPETKSNNPETKPQMPPMMGIQHKVIETGGNFPRKHQADLEIELQDILNVEVREIPETTGAALLVAPQTIKIDLKITQGCMIHKAEAVKKSKISFYVAQQLRLLKPKCRLSLDRDSWLVTLTAQTLLAP